METVQIIGGTVAISTAVAMGIAAVVMLAMAIAEADKREPNSRRAMRLFIQGVVTIALMGVFIGVAVAVLRPLSDGG